MSLPPRMQNINEFKSRNILNLEERIKVIRYYEHGGRTGCRPSLQSLADKFCCSSKQIKNIIRNKADILLTYQSRIPELSKDDAQQRRREKIEFLGKVMYEYIERMVYHRLPIDAMKVCWKATEVKECIAVENFIVTEAWLNNFQKTYGLPSLNMDALRNNVVIYSPKEAQFNAIDLIQYVSRQEQRLTKKVSPAIDRVKIDFMESVEEKQQSHGSTYELSKPYAKSNLLSQENFNHNVSTINEYKNNNESVNKSIETHNIMPLADIETVEQALLHIKVLEEFAMLRDNYRAIGLLTQLEVIFKKEIQMD